jgi:hypothetical protein
MQRLLVPDHQTSTRRAAERLLGAFSCVRCVMPVKPVSQSDFEKIYRVPEKQDFRTTGVLYVQPKDGDDGMSYCVRSQDFRTKADPLVVASGKSGAEAEAALKDHWTAQLAT